MEINFVAVGLAALSAFFLGFVWYTIIFAKPWQKEIGLKLDPNQPVQNPDLGKSLAISFALEVVMALVISYFVPSAADAMFGLSRGIAIGAAVALGFGVNYCFEGKTVKHWAINAAYNIVVFGVMGLIIGVL